MVRRRIGIGPGGPQQFDDFHAMSSRRQMQGGIADVKPVKDFGHIQPGFDDQVGRKASVLPEQFFDPWAVVVNNRGEESVHR
jgi:hypothetical protein